MAGHGRRGCDEIADLGGIERGEIALSQRRQHLRERLESHGVDRDADQIRDQNRLAGGVTSNPLDAGHVAEGILCVAVRGLPAGLQNEEPGRVTKRLHLGQEHVEGRTRPVPLESTRIAIGCAADQVERGGMPREQIDHLWAGHVDRRRRGER